MILTVLCCLALLGALMGPRAHALGGPANNTTAAIPYVNPLHWVNASLPCVNRTLLMVPSEVDLVVSACKERGLDVWLDQLVQLIPPTQTYRVFVYEKCRIPLALNNWDRLHNVLRIPCPNIGFEVCLSSALSKACHWLFNGTQNFPTIDFFQKFFVSPWMGVGGHLVTKRVFEYP